MYDTLNMTYSLSLSLSLGVSWFEQYLLCYKLVLGNSLLKYFRQAGKPITTSETQVGMKWF